MISDVPGFARMWGLNYQTVYCQLRRGYCKWPRQQADGHKDHYLYPLFTTIKSRCYNKNRHNYPHYGGRGIRMCTAWYLSFEQFVRDIEALGPRPPGYTLDRINNDGNYEPGNVRWASQAAQCQNRRPTKLNGITSDNNGQTYRVRVCRDGRTLTRRCKTFEDALKIRVELADKLVSTPIEEERE